MLRIIVENEFFNEETDEFEVFDDLVLDFEHSLVSLSKWESFFGKPFLGLEKKSSEEILEYVKMMIVTPDYPSDVLQRLSNENLAELHGYIESNQTATTFGSMPETQHKASGEIVTAELIYYWMVAFNIPFECEKWHLNRLFALVRICNLKNSKPKKLSRGEIAERNRRLNAERRAQFGTSG